MTHDLKRITLYFKSGGSDKVYHAALEPSGAGFLVNFAFGRRGSTLQTGSKTASPVEYAAARKIFDKLIAEKTAKGYTPGEDGTPYQQTSLEDRSTGIVPQLLNAIDEKEVQLLVAAANWWAQEKFDGRRILIRKAAGEITGINRKGLTVTLAQSIADCALKLAGDQWLIDGEALGDRFVAFDMLENAGCDLRQNPYRRRLKTLADLMATRPASPVFAVETASEPSDKAALWKRLLKSKAEGIVFKDADASYSAGRPSSGGPALKFKFVATASCIVAGASRAKRSIALELIDGAARVGVGNVTIPPNTLLPETGKVVEVRYLYAFVGGSLYQPVYLGSREDIDTAGCLVTQLKYKPEDDADS